MKTRNIATVLTATLLLSGCAAAAPPGAIRTPEVTFQHIHKIEIGQNDAELLVAAHDGLYRVTAQADGEATVVGPVGGFDFDLMSFAIAGDTAYASGHPGPGTADSFGNPNLGLITSTDLGKNWVSLSLTGVTDFHALTAAEDDSTHGRVFGIDTSKQRIQRSMDGGETWSEGAEIVARDILAVTERLYATTPNGLAVSDDQGSSFVIDSDAPDLYLVAADGAGQLAGIDIHGNLWVRGAGDVWATGGTVTGGPQSIAAGTGRIYVADDRGIAFTSDKGATWTVLTMRF
jgi:sugar lactone lactonase YvrE